MKVQKIHLKLRGRPLCGQRQHTRKLKFSQTEGDVTCGNCKKAIAK